MSSAAKPKLVFVSVNDLDRVKLDEDERTKDAHTLLELLQPAIGEPCLKALRHILFLTYAGNDGLPSEACITVRDPQGKLSV